MSETDTNTIYDVHPINGRRGSLQVSYGLREAASLDELTDRPAVVRAAYTVWLPFVHTLQYHWSEGTIHEATDLIVALFYLFAVPFQFGFETGVGARLSQTRASAVARARFRTL